jgi:excisionase family DNA binding protein
MTQDGRPVPPSVPEQPDLTPRQAAKLSGSSYWTVLKEIERGHLKAYRRPGNKIAIRHDDYYAWAYGTPIEPKERTAVLDQAPRPSRRRPARGSVIALRNIERRAG